MVKKIVGFDDKGNKVFERDARDYDKSITKTVFGLTLGDVIKTVPIIFLAGIVYAHQDDFNKKLFAWHKEDVATIAGIQTTLENLNSWLSASTGKPFKDGMPVGQAEIGANAPNFK